MKYDVLDTWTLWHGYDPQKVPPEWNEGKQNWSDIGIEGKNDFETPNDTEIEGSFAFVRESWSVNCLFERYFAGDYVNLVWG